MFSPEQHNIAVNQVLAGLDESMSVQPFGNRHSASQSRLELETA
jgi:hypothetical protein